MRSNVPEWLAKRLRRRKRELGPALPAGPPGIPGAVKRIRKRPPPSSID